MEKYTASMENHEGLRIAVLRCDGDAGESMEAWIAPDFGANLCRFIVDGMNVIDSDFSVLTEGGYTGTPVLYPTPNRVRNGRFRYDGRLFRQTKNGREVHEHGLVHDEPWRFDPPVAGADHAQFDAWVDFTPGSGIYASFPFDHRLALRFTVDRSGVSIEYRIESRCGEEIPFGFGLHPYFTKLSGDEGTFVSLPAQAVMDYTSDLLPTGRLIDVKGTLYDLGEPTPVGKLDLDHVFTSIPEGRHATASYRTRQIGVTLENTADFTHLVLYTPSGEPYFCIENQTCSTDAHNLYDSGFKTESGLKTVPARAKTEGRVKYAVSRG
ncbi:MAG: aldose 1-epimerase [Clostridia bacterium]|nr:aldose 1-epimerase [Clostridia bacterium]